MSLSKNRKMKKTRLVLNWVLRILLSLGFLLASVGKLTSNPAIVEMFEHWGYPDGFHLVIGIIELLLAILIVIPKTLKIAIVGMAVVLFGALGTHLLNDPILEIIRPLIFLILLGGVSIINYRYKD